MLDCVQITVSTIVKLKKYMDIGRMLINNNMQNASLKDKMSQKSGEGDYLRNRDLRGQHEKFTVVSYTSQAQDPWTLQGLAALG